MQSLYHRPDAIPNSRTARPAAALTVMALTAINSAIMSTRISALSIGIVRLTPFDGLDRL